MPRRVARMAASRPPPEVAMARAAKTTAATDAVPRRMALPETVPTTRPRRPPLLLGTSVRPDDEGCDGRGELPFTPKQPTGSSWDPTKYGLPATRGHGSRRGVAGKWRRIAGVAMSDCAQAGQACWRVCVVDCYGWSLMDCGCWSRGAPSPRIACLHAAGPEIRQRKRRR